ncbi:MAG: hypothetical protein RLZZ127_1286 [Planctomycetota bacterium]|jgi:hypothetical protein
MSRQYNKVEKANRRERRIKREKARLKVEIVEAKKKAKTEKKAVAK